MRNWYQTIKMSQKSPSSTRKVFLLGVAMGLIPLTPNIVTDIMKVPEEKAQQMIETQPELVKQEAKQLADRIQPPETTVVNDSPEIDIKKIIQIESSGNPKAISPVGARGLMQIMEPTWREVTQMLGKDYGWNEAFDPKKNTEVGTFYINNRIPQMLNHYDIPDTTATRLAAYNWGIGNLLRAYKEKGENWLELAPSETKNYINKYNST